MAGELEELRAAGDMLQSSASRLAEWVLEQQAGHQVPYEVHMAALEAEHARDKWTETRRHSRA